MTEQDEVEPFRVTLELAEPVLVNRSVAFDGLLAHLRFLRTGDAATAHHALPLADVAGVELLFLGPVVRPEGDACVPFRQVNTRSMARRVHSA